MTAILHIGSIAGVPQQLSRAERRLGLKSDVISFQHHIFEYDVDFPRPTCWPFPLKYIEKMQSISSIVGDYDILHFHYFSVLPFGVDLPIWKKLGKKVVYHYHGDDIRNRGESIFSRRYADAVLVSTPDLLAWSSRAVWSPNPIDLKEYSFVGADDKDETLRIVHAPSDPKVKGTEYVIKAVEELKSEGYRIELDLVKDMPHQKALEHYRQADIVVDQLLVGWYGVFAIECMALGKPVCVYIREDLKSYLPKDLPIIATSHKDIKRDISMLIDDASLRSNIGKKGRLFAELVHDSKRIAEHLCNNIYI